MNARNLNRGLRAAIKSFRYQPVVESDVEKLRKRATPNFPFAILCFAMVIWWAVRLKKKAIFVHVDGSDFLTTDAIMLWCFIYAGIRSIWVSSHDRLLLQLAERFEEEKEPNQTPEPTAAAGRGSS